MDEFDNSCNPTLLNCCHNIFCFSCITISSNKNNICPYCKAYLHKEDINIISHDKNIINHKSKEMIGRKNKDDTLREILQNENPNKKYIIFANFYKTFEKIKIIVNDLGLTYKILKGRANTIKKTINEFVSGKLSVLMLNAKYYGAGMNLQIATDIIIYHRFDQDLEQQIIGRAQRIGRSEPLNIYYLLHDNELISRKPKN